MEYKYTDLNGEPQSLTEKETWCWVANYENGTKLSQFDNEKSEYHYFSEIDQSELSSFQTVSEGKAPITILFNPRTDSLIHFYKRTRLNVGTESEQFITFYCVGKATTVNHRSIKTILVITPSGEVIVTENPDLIGIE